FYRTKDLAMAAWFMDLCAALNRHGPEEDAPLHVRRILLRPGCSWDEHVVTAPCPAPAIERYFVRAGALARLLERLGAVDFHVENVLLAGEYPVLADIETLFAPWPPQPSPATRAFIASPLWSALVAAPVLGEPGRRAISAAGLNPGG